MDHYHSQFETDAATYNGDSNINREEFNRGHELHANDDEQDYVKPSFNRHDSSSGKLFVGGISWETSEESFLKYFSNFGEVVDSVIMMDKTSGRPRGFGFVTFADSAVANEVLAKEHTLDGRVVEVKRTVSREDMEATGVFKTKKIFVGGLPHFLTDDELMAYFSTYGNIALYQIMVDHNTGRSRGFGFVTFVSEDSVEKVFSAGKIHEIGGKQVEIKRAERKRFGVDYNSSSQRSYGGFCNGTDGSGGHSSRGRNHGKRVVPYADPGMNGSFGQFDGSYGVNSAPAYGGYSEYGYGYGYGGPMYCFGGYGANSYGNAAGYGGIAIYGDGNAYGRAGNFYRTSGCDSDGFTPGRYHPYWR